MQQQGLLEEGRMLTRSNARKVEAGQGPILVQQLSHCQRVFSDAGHIGARGEGPDLERPVFVFLQLPGKLLEVCPPVLVLSDCHDGGYRLSPPQFVGVVLKRPMEYHRTDLVGDVVNEIVRSACNSVLSVSAMRNCNNEILPFLEDQIRPAVK